MDERFSRTRALLGDAAMRRLQNSRVAVFGLGGVGGYVAEALARSGIGTFYLVDNDTVSLSNLNRQILATEETVGQYKVDVAKQRILSINPAATVHTYPCFYLPETADSVPIEDCDYVVDAIDTVSGKLAIIERAKAAGVAVISSMGTGNKLDPSALRIGDVFRTEGCPLARVMRRELRARGIKELKVVWSPEPPLTPIGEEEMRRVPASVAFVPSVAGLLISGEVVRDLTKDESPAGGAL